MRTTVEIIEAVQEQESVSEQELKYALLCMWYWLNMSRQSLSKMAQDPQPLRCQIMSKELCESSFRMLKASVDEYLGPNWTPGTPENTAQRQRSKAIIDKVLNKALAS